MKKKPLRWGLLSTARINDAVIPGIIQSSYSELYGVASRSQSRAEEYAVAKNIPHAYGMYQEMIDDPNIDVIYNSLPNHLHAEWTVRAACAGKHVLCEKPMALSRSEMRSIKTAAIDNQIVVMEALMYRSHPRTHKVMELVNQGMVGDLLFLRGSFTNPLKRVEDYRWIPEFGGGALWDLGCYPVSYAIMLAGSAPDYVLGSQIDYKTGVDVFFAGQMSFQNQVLAQFDCGLNAPYQTYFEIIGSKATIFINFPYARGNNSIPILFRQDKKEIPITYEDQDGFYAQIDGFNRAVLEGNQPAISLNESDQINQTLLALFNAARDRAAVNLTD